MSEAAAIAGPAPRAPAQLAHDAPLCIVFNVGSGSGDALASQREMQRILTDAGRRHEPFLVRHARDVIPLARRAAERAVAQRGAVVAVGLDGTVNTVVQAMLASGRPFGVVPQGTFHSFGRTHGIPVALEAATRVLLGARLRPVQ